MQILVVSSSGPNAATRALLRSIRRHQPDAAITVLLADPRARAEGTDEILAADLTVDGLRYIDLWMAGGPAFAQWAAIPGAIRAMAPTEPVLVLPEHAWITAELSRVVDGVAPHDVRLFPTAHDTTGGFARHGWLEGMAVIGSAEAPALVSWERLVGEAVRVHRATDPFDFDHPWRRFVDAGPLVQAITDPSLRVGPDNVDTIAVTADGDEIFADGHALRIARFPGFEATTPWWYVAAGATEPLQRSSDNPALRTLCHAYAAELDPLDGRPARDAAVVGIRLSSELHAAFRSRLLVCLDEGSTPPNPLRADEVEPFLDWLRGPGTPDVTGVNLAADLIWATRPDLAQAFPNVRWGGQAGFVRWLWTHGLDEGLVTTAVLPDIPTVRRVEAAPQERVFGVNLIGYHGSELGLGVAVRRIGAALDAAEIPWTKVTYDRTNSRQRERSERSTNTPYWFNLILIAPDQLGYFVGDVGPGFFEGHYNIGLWYWETDVMRPSQTAAFSHLDEVWGATTYLRDVFAAHTNKPVTLVPIPLEFDMAAFEHARSDAATRRRLGLDDRFTFLFSLDFLSISQRKNPLELVDAYRRAFTADDGTRLIIKSINGDRHVREVEEIRDAFADRSDIELWDRYLDAADRLALVAAADCYVSLHRSEGLGLTMAEAMAAGTPVIATGYSGNLDFMPPGSALLVDSKEVEIGEGSFYPAEGHWAQPDLEHAASLMREVRSDAELRARLSAAGPVALSRFTSPKVGATMRRLLRARWDDC